VTKASRTTTRPLTNSRALCAILAVTAAALAGCSSSGSAPTVVTSGTTTQVALPPEATTTLSTETIVPVAPPVIFLQDDFSTPDPERWLVRRTSGVTYAFRRGAYRMWVRHPRANHPEYSLTPFSGKVDGLRVEVDVREQAGGSGFEVMGIVCVANRNAGGYFFGVGPHDGFYSIEKINSSAFTALKEGRGSKRINGLKRKNHIRGECIGQTKKRPTTLRLFVNCHRVAAARDEHGSKSFRGVGLVVFSVKGGTDVYFDNVLAEHP
jgi:hypothetical protein